MTEQSSELTNDELVKLIEQEISNSVGGGGDDSNIDSDLAEVWQKAMDYYFGKPRGDEVDGRSHVISMDLADMVEQTMAYIMPSFDTDNLGSFSAYDIMDENQAKSESDAVNWCILEQNNGYMEFAAAIKDALLQRNGIIKVWVDEHFEIQDEEYNNIGVFEIQQLLQDQNIEVTGSEEVDPGMFTEDGLVLSEPKFNISTRKKIPIKQLKVKAIPPESFSVNSDHDSIFLDDARFCKHTELYTRSELKKMGFDPEIIDDLPAKTTKTSSAQRARSRSSSEDDSESAQRESDRIEVDECYYQVDSDGDGITERRKIIKAGKHILDNEQFPIVAFASGTAFLLPHRFWCISLYDKLKQIQDQKTAFLRKTLDNAEGMINQRVIALNGQVNMDDLLSSRPSGIVRAKRVDAVTAFPVQNMGDTGFRMLNYLDKVRKEAGGSQLDLGTQENVPVQGQTAHGMERWMSSQEQLAFLMVKTLANTLIKQTYRIAHIMMRMYMPERLTYKSNGKLVTTSPGMWPPRAQVVVNIQLSMAEKQRKYLLLQEIINQQNGMMQIGLNGVITSSNHIYNALIDQAKIAGLELPDRYWIDPASPQAQQAAQANQQAAQKAKQEEIQQNDKILIMQQKISELQEGSDRLKADLEYSIKVNEQLRKWAELELQYDTDIPGQGLKK